MDEHRRQVVNTGGNSNNGLLVALVETAVKTATQDYVPVARMANNTAVAVLPYGKYNPKVGQDGTDPTRVPASSPR